MTIQISAVLQFAHDTSGIIEEVEALGSELEQKTQEYEELKILYENSQKLKVSVVEFEARGLIFELSLA
jgi:hypothetical protein